MGEPREHKVSL